MRAAGYSLCTGNAAGEHRKVGSNNAILAKLWQTNIFLLVQTSQNTQSQDPGIRRDFIKEFIKFGEVCSSQHPQYLPVYFSTANETTPVNFRSLTSVQQQQQPHHQSTLNIEVFSFDLSRHPTVQNFIKACSPTPYACFSPSSSSPPFRPKSPSPP